MTTINLRPGQLAAGRRAFSLACLSVVLLLAGCGQSGTTKQHAAEVEADAKHYVDQLREQKFDEIEHDADPGTFPVDGHQTLLSMAAMFPAQQPLSVKVVGSSAFQGADFYNSSINLEYEFPQEWVLVHFSTHETANATWITEFQVQQMSQSIENINRFTLVGKDGLQYMVLFFAVASFLLSLYAFVVCSNYPPAEPGALRLLAPQRGLIATDETKTILVSAIAATQAFHSSIQFLLGVCLAAHRL